MSSVNVTVNRNDTIINVGINSSGPKGLDAYETWLALGNVGTKQQFIDSQFDEPTRVTNENTRKSAELIRISNENTRIASENAREDSEDIRVTDENIRVSNENTRISNENARNVYEDYDNTHAYVVGNKVYYNGSSYINKIACTGVLPTVLDNWLLISAGGNTPAASAVQLQDSSGYFTATNVELALKETKEQINTLGAKTIYLKQHSSDITLVGLNQFIINKLSEGYNKFIVPMGYVLNETLDIARIRSTNPNITNGVVIEGEGGRNDIDVVEPHLILNTGGIGVRLIETHSVTLKNLNITTDGATNKSTVGIILTRDSSFGGSSNTNTLENISIKMHSDKTVNIGNGTVGIYNNTSETITYKELDITADIPIVIDKYDIFNLCPTNSYIGSNKDHYFVGKNIFVSHGGENSICLLINGAENIYGSLYFATYNATSTSRAIKVKDLANGNMNIDCELTPIFLYVENGIISNTIFNGIAVNAQTFIVTNKIDVATIINACEFNVYVSYASTKQYITQGASTEISASKFWLSSDISGSIIDVSGTFLGNHITCRQKPTINYLGGSTKFGNVIHTYTGLLLNNENIINFSYRTPSASYAPFKDGDLYFNFDTGYTGSPVGYTHYNGSWNEFGQNGYRIVTIAQIPTAVPRKKGEITFDENNDAYIAFGTSAGQFKKMT